MDATSIRPSCSYTVTRTPACRRWGVQILLRTQYHRLAPRSRTSTLLCRAEGEDIKDLLARDKKLAKVVDQLPGLDAFGGDVEDVLQRREGAEGEGSTQQQQEQEGGPGKLRGKGKRRRARKASEDAAAAASGGRATGRSAAGDDSGPRTAREAIDAGLAAFAQGRHQEAVELFGDALELPGSGFMRMEGTVREYSCASEGEENCALYNMACAYAAMGQVPAALACVEGLLENNFDDYATLRTDPDLAALKGEQLESLLSKYDNPIKKLFGFGKGSKGGERPFFSAW